MRITRSIGCTKIFPSPTSPVRAAERIAFDTRLDERLGAHHFDLHFFVELHDECRTSILLDQLVFAAVTADAAQRDPRDPGPKQRRLDLGRRSGRTMVVMSFIAGLPVDWGWGGGGATGSIAATAGGATFSEQPTVRVPLSEDHCGRGLLPVLWKCCWMKLAQQHARPSR